MANAERAARSALLLRQRLGRVPTAMLTTGLLALAGISCSAALAECMVKRAPERAAALWPQNGFAVAGMATQAVASHAATQTRGGPVAAPDLAPAQLGRLPDNVLALSRQALRAEPVSVQASRSLALYFQSVGQDDRARQLMRAVSRLSRRDAAANLWLVDDYLRAGDTGRAARLIDATLRTDTRASALLLPGFVTLLDEPPAAGFLRELLLADPPWQHDFWSAVLEAETLPAGAASLRAQLHRRGVALAPGHDARLVSALIEARRFDAAFALRTAVRAASPAMTSALAPIDWRLVADNRYGAVVEADGVLAVEALGGAEGVIAQKLLALPAGRYRIAAPHNAGPEQLGLRLTCAELRGAETFAQTLALVADGSLVVSQNSNCHYVWLSIVLSKADRDRSFAIQALTVTRIGAGE